jgi:hypothetical protein
VALVQASAVECRKAEIIWFATTANLNRLHTDDKRITIGPIVIEPSSVVRDLGVYFNAELLVRDHRHASIICDVYAPFGGSSAATS